MLHSLVIRGDRALFQRPDCTDPLSYPIPTGSALRGILGCIWDHPGTYIDIREIQVLNPIRWDREGITETRGRSQANDPKGGPPIPRLNEKAGWFEEPLRLRRVTYRTVLRDPAWLVRFSIQQFPGRVEGQHPLHEEREIFEQRVDRGSYDQPPSLGVDEYRAIIHRPDGTETPIKSSRDFGWVLHDIDFRQDPPVQHVYRAIMRDGVIPVPSYWEKHLSRREAA